jgi:PAS domain S-box-containing protein
VSLDVPSKPDAAPLELTREQYHSMMQMTHSAVVCLAPDQRIILWNRGAELTFGYAAEEVLGRDYFQLFLPPEWREPVGTELGKLLRGEFTRNYENPVLTRDGTQRTMLWNASRLTGTDGRILGVVAIGQDITELKRAQRLQAGENRALEMLAQGHELAAVLTEIAATIEIVCPEIRCLVRTADPEAGRLSCSAGPSIPEDLRRSLEGVPIGPVGAAGAAHTGEPAICPDIESDPGWSRYRLPALLHGLRSCWSHAILGAGGRVLGALDCYGVRVRRPSRFELDTTARAARLAGIAITHVRVREERLRESENRIQEAVSELEALRKELKDRFSFDDVVAVSGPMLRVIRMAAQVAPTEATVLVTGETGTGKEVIARTIHANSSRAAGPFIAVNCGAIPETLMESELFGHERGAFTSADRRKIGQVERANGGTLFLDEVAELTPSAQVKLLRLLQEKTFERLGGSQTLVADARVIAATNRNLAEEMEKGTFREDLYYRLNVFHIHVPPLRERKEAIPVLAEKTLRRIAIQLGRTEIALSKAALQVMEEYAWKGNVRELQNALERAAILCGGSLIGPEHLPIQSASNRSLHSSGGDDEIVVRLEDGFSIEKLERTLVRRALRLARGNKSKAARILGISRGSFRWRLDNTRAE